MFKKLKNKNPENDTVYQMDGHQPKDDNKMSKKKKIIIATISLLLVAIIAFGIYVFTLFNVKKTYQYVASLTDLPEPNQVEASGVFESSLDGYDITFTKKADYTITGKVVEKHYYFPFDIINKISRFDLGIVWGPLLSVDLKDKISFNNDGKRFLKYKYKASLINELGSEEAIVNSLSNNHVIHSNEHTLKLLRNVKKGDYIKIEGYLVDVTYKGKRNGGSWTTSTTRTDHGDGACEIIYVTNVIWLKLAG